MIIQKKLRKLKDGNLINIIIKLLKNKLRIERMDNFRFAIILCRVLFGRFAEYERVYLLVCRAVFAGFAG